MGFYHAPVQGFWTVEYFFKGAKVPFLQNMSLSTQSRFDKTLRVVKMT